MHVEFYGIRKPKRGCDAIVHASVDGKPVVWDKRGWRCWYECDLDECAHISAVMALLAESLLDAMDAMDNR